MKSKHRKGGEGGVVTTIGETFDKGICAERPGGYKVELVELHNEKTFIFYAIYIIPFITYLPCRRFLHGTSSPYLKRKLRYVCNIYVVS